MTSGNLVNDYFKFQIKSHSTQTLKCSCCFEDIERNMFVFKDHACRAVFCSECIKSWVVSKIREFSSSIVCISQDCRAPFSFNEIKEIIKGDTLLENKYEESLLSSYLKRAPGFCWCPNPKCGTGFVVEERDLCDSPFIKCISCETNFCATCKTKAHFGYSCEQYKLRLVTLNRSSDLETRSLSYIQKEMKECPKCKVPIEKNFGCSHMRCINCENEFCWECLKPYEHPHFCNEKPNEYFTLPIIPVPSRITSTRPSTLYYRPLNPSLIPMTYPPIIPFIPPPSYAFNSYMMSGGLISNNNNDGADLGTKRKSDTMTLGDGDDETQSERNTKRLFFRW